MDIRGITKWFGFLGVGFLLAGCQVRELPESGTAGGPSASTGDAPGAPETRTLPGVQPGVVMLLDVWAPWDAPSRAGQGDIDRVARDYQSAGLRVVGLTLADEQNRDGVPAVSYERIVVQRDQLEPLIQIRALPTRLLIDRHGVVRHVYPGPYLPPGFEDDLKALLKDKS